MEPGWQTLFESFPANEYILMNVRLKYIGNKRSICLNLCSKYVENKYIMQNDIFRVGERIQNFLNEIKRTILKVLL